MEKVCPMTRTLNLLGKKWNLRLLRQLNDKRTKRFNEMLRDAGGISSRTLSKRLVELESSGLVKRTRFSEIPPRVEYSLTEAGLELIACFRYMDRWALKHAIKQ